jgi:hypothetical protein
MGDEMPKKASKKKKDSSHILYYLAAILIIILFLKGLGILKAVFNIDPEGITFNFDIGYLTSAALFVIVLDRLHKQNDIFAKQGERIARIEGMLENQAKKP